MAISVYTYPFLRRDFQRLFMRFDIIEGIVDPTVEGKIKDKIESSVYLPLPVGLLRENHVIEYDAFDFGIQAELVKQNFNAVASGISNIFGEGNAGPIEQDVTDMVGNLADKVGTEVTKSFKTFIDQQITGAQSLGIPTILQAQGLAQRANYSYAFTGIEQPRDFVLEWSFFPKNYADANSIETIIKVVQKASLPEIKNKTFFDSVVESADNLFTDRQTSNDVYETQPTRPTGLYSTTFNLPRKFKIKIFERTVLDNYSVIEDADIKEITHLMNFPHEMVVTNIMVEHAEGDNNLPPFVKYVTPLGDVEFFHSSYKIRISMSDMQVTTSQNVNLSY
ncbi:hypothetical protein EB155_08185 [archaeon]|nr:hypothetical protein [archaeon]